MYQQPSSPLSEFLDDPTYLKANEYCDPLLPQSAPSFRRRLLTISSKISGLEANGSAATTTINRTSGLEVYSPLSGMMEVRRE